ncbi:Uncharacterised protein [Nocardia otitidiscaviarum]|uniref:Uncharacterized protein n=1 Tax=Nocardia otitidiscaviarum TaxID=1823 RepID=A0A379JHY5_9NOCA|nr:Uncharacterised protein [Nocardia otitidiscaviarum]
MGLLRHAGLLVPGCAELLWGSAVLLRSAVLWGSAVLLRSAVLRGTVLLGCTVLLGRAGHRLLGPRSEPLRWLPARRMRRPSARLLVGVRLAWVTHLSNPVHLSGKESRTAAPMRGR